MSGMLLVWLGTLLILLLWWEIRAMPPAILLLSVLFIFNTWESGDRMSALLGLATAPVLGGLALTLGFRHVQAATIRSLAPAMTVRALAGLALFCSVFLLPLDRLVPYLPETAQHVTFLRLLVSLALTGFVFLGLAELPVTRGFGLVLLLLAINIPMAIAYGALIPFMLLVNTLEVGALVLLARQSLRLPMWLAWHEREAAT